MIFIFIPFHIVNITRRVPFFFSKNQHDYKCDIDLCNSSINKKLILKDYVLDTICPAFALFLIPNTATALFCVSEQHDSDPFLNESTV